MYGVHASVVMARPPTDGKYHIFDLAGQSSEVHGTKEAVILGSPPLLISWLSRE